MANNPTPAPIVSRDALLFEGVAEGAELEPEPVAAGDAVAWALTPPLTKPVSVSCKFSHVRVGRMARDSELTAGSEEPIARAAVLKLSNVLPVLGALIDLFGSFRSCPFQRHSHIVLPDHSLTAVSSLLAVEPNC
jgi:hypothetical protein